MTTVYLDELFLLNALLDYLLLACSARLAGEPLRRGRMTLGALLGGGYAAAAVLPGMGWLNAWACKLGAALLMVLAGLGSSRRLLRQTAIFFAVACAFAGVTMALGFAFGGGAGAVPGKAILLAAAGCCAALTAVLRGAVRHGAARGELVPVTLRLADRRVTLTALTDTGNTLTDPVSGRAVVVAEGEYVRDLFGTDGPDLGELADPAEGIGRLNRGVLCGRLSLLPYRAVGVEHGLLLAVRLDSVRIGGRERGALLAALSPTPVSDGGGYHALVGEENV